MASCTGRSLILATAAYWFRRVGKHPIFPHLRDAAAELGWRVKDKWDPFAFIDYCESARKRTRFYRGEDSDGNPTRRVATACLTTVRGRARECSRGGTS